MKVRKNSIEKEVSPKAYRLFYKEQGYEAAEDVNEEDVEDVNEEAAEASTGNPPEAPADYDAMKVDELKALAKLKEIEGYSKMNKEELIAALEASEVDEEV